MTDKVPVLSMVFMSITGLMAFAIPVALLLWYRKKKHADILPFFIGCAVMMAFALTLESIVHTIVLATPAGQKIKSNIWLYALYGGAMAGLFEETGRWIAFKTVLKKRQGKNANALMYGAGHGGFEAAMIVGTAMISNLVMAVLINMNAVSYITGSLEGEVLEQINTAIKTLVTTSPYMFLASLAERISTIILHIALSVLVWFAAKNRKRWILFPAAILIHLAVDALSVILSGVGTPVAVTEAAIAVMALLTAVFSKKIWDSEIAAEATVQEPV